MAFDDDVRNGAMGDECGGRPSDWPHATQDDKRMFFIVNGRVTSLSIRRTSYVIVEIACLKQFRLRNLRAWRTHSPLQAWTCPTRRCPWRIEVCSFDDCRCLASCNGARKSKEAQSQGSLIRPQSSMVLRELLLCIRYLSLGQHVPCTQDHLIHACPQPPPSWILLLPPKSHCPAFRRPQKFASRTWESGTTR
jgi:hypothetical protein